MAQLSACRTRNPEVPGASPALTTSVCTRLNAVAFILFVIRVRRLFAGRVYFKNSNLFLVSNSLVRGLKEH